MPRSEWNYRLLLRMPELLGPGQLASIAGELAEKKDIPLLAAAGLYTKPGSRCVQMLHKGPSGNPKR